MEKDPIRLLMERHGWDYQKSRRHVRRATALLKGMVTGFWESELKRYQMEQAATIQALIDTGHPAADFIEKDVL